MSRQYLRYGYKRHRSRRDQTYQRNRSVRDWVSVFLRSTRSSPLQPPDQSDAAVDGTITPVFQKTIRKTPLTNRYRADQAFGDIPVSKAPNFSPAARIFVSPTHLSIELLPPPRRSVTFVDSISSKNTTLPESPPGTASPRQEADQTAGGTTIFVCRSRHVFVAVAMLFY
jgi:hypothetical protein